MGQRANIVMRLCEELKRLSLSDGELAKGPAASVPPPEEHRPPKRPWEDISADGAAGTDAEVCNDFAHCLGACADYLIIAYLRRIGAGNCRGRYGAYSYEACHNCRPERSTGPAQI
jgi:hypothetical protein